MDWITNLDPHHFCKATTQARQAHLSTMTNKSNDPQPPNNNDLFSLFGTGYSPMINTRQPGPEYTRLTLKQIIEAAIAIAQEDLDISDDDVPPPPSPDTPGARAA
jgi:hypothetical protein